MFFIFLKISSVFLSTCLSPFCFRTQKFSITFQISDCTVFSIFCQLVLQSLQNLHLFPPLTLVFSLLPSRFPWSTSSHSTHTHSSPYLLAKTVFWKFISCVLITNSDGLCNHLLFFPYPAAFSSSLFLKANESIFSFCWSLLSAPHFPSLTCKP